MTDFDPFASLKALEQDDFARARRTLPPANPAHSSVPPAKPAVTFPCVDCGGTGYYRGVRVHQDKAHCFACKGRGWFVKSAQDRAASRAKSQAKKLSKHEAKQAEFNAAYPGMVAFLKANTWSSFCVDLLANYERWGSLTDNQAGAVTRMMAKMAVKAEERKVEAQLRQVAVDLTPIKRMFEAALTSGLKKTIYRAEGLVLSLAKVYSTNPGAIYVKDISSGEYLGKVLDGTFHATRAATDDQKARLQAIAANPLEAAIRWGQKTKQCSCCGLTLTNKLSVELGIGPICRGKWGL